MSERKWGVWLISPDDVEELTRIADLGGKDEQRLVTIADNTVKRPMNCILCEERTLQADIARIGVCLPIVVAAGDEAPSFVVCRSCASKPDMSEKLRATVRQKFGIDAQPVYRVNETIQ